MARFFRRRKFCRFTAEGVQEIDYKDLNTLKAYITETGKIVPRPHHRHQGSLPASAGDRYQARSLRCSAALLRSSLRFSEFSEISLCGVLLCIAYLSGHSAVELPD